MFDEAYDAAYDEEESHEDSGSDDTYSSDDYDEDDEIIVLGGLESMLVVDLFDEPIFEPDPFDDIPEKFEEVAGEEFSLGGDERYEPSYALTETIMQLLQPLDEVERIVVQLHFGIGEDEPFSTREIADEFDLDESRVKIIFARGLSRLRGWR